MILAIVLLWPSILGWDNPIYQVALVIVLAVLVVLVVGKFRRMGQVYDETKVNAKKRGKR